MVQNEREKYGFRKQVVNQNLFKSWLNRVLKRFQKKEKKKRNECYSRKWSTSRKLRLKSLSIEKLGKKISQKWNRKQNLWKNTQMLNWIQCQNENRIEKHLLDLSLKNSSLNDPNLEAINQRWIKARFKIQHEMKTEMYLMKSLK